MRLAIALLAFLAAPVPTIDWPAAGLEDGTDGWRFDDQMSTRSSEQAAAGRWSLKVVDTSTTAGSNVFLPPVPIDGLGVYRLSAQVYPVSGTGLGVYVQVLDAEGNLTVAGDAFQMSAPSTPTGQWVPFSLLVTAGARARALRVWIHSYNAAQVTAYLDDFAMTELEPQPPAPPLWPAEYKLRPDQTERLTAADVVGPDGIVYPNWTRVGVPGGIPEVAVVARVDEHGGRADDGADDADAILRAVDATAALGGGAVLFGPGTYHLSRMIQIRHDGIVLRGAGRDRTRIVFDYSLGPDGLRWGEPDDEVLRRGSNISLHARPTNLKTMVIEADGREIARWAPSTHSGNTFWLTTRADPLLAGGAAEVTLRGIATWGDGTSHELTRTVRLARDETDPAAAARPMQHAAISFCGAGWSGNSIPLVEDGKRGATSIRLASTEGLAPGDALMIDGPATERWKTLTRNKCEWGTYRRYLVRIAGIEGDLVRLEQPLRIEFPVVDGSRVQKHLPVRRCGIEDLTIEQTENLWISSVIFSHAWECWARGVAVTKCGRFPVYGLMAKWCSIEDCLFDDAWYKGGGGTAYAGWEHSYDCLMDRCETRRLRHAPCVQWSASGNVIRRSRFIDSDAQWHSGWTNENLFEQCEVRSVTGNGGYGYGAWASPPEDTAHGPNGPRNVVYGCDISSPKTGLWMGGMNENWLILYNRFRVESGNAVFAKTYSFDHLIRGNVFILGNPADPAVMLATPDCSGVEVVGNRIHGGAEVTIGGVSAPQVDEGNEHLPHDPDAPRPQPAVASIYDWQQANVTPR